MPSSFPGGTDSFTNPVSNSPLNSPSHSALHTDINDAVNKIETFMGLVLVSRTTISGTSTAISNCFSSRYSNYRVLVRLTSSGVGNIALQLGSATTNYKSYLWTNFVSWTSGAAATQTSTANLILGYSNGNGTGSIDLYSPNLSTQSWAHGTYAQVDNGGIVAGYQLDATSFTGCTILAPTGASGTCWIYGYRD